MNTKQREKEVLTHRRDRGTPLSLLDKKLSSLWSPPSFGVIVNQVTQGPEEPEKEEEAVDEEDTEGVEVEEEKEERWR